VHGFEKNKMIDQKQVFTPLLFSPNLIRQKNKKSHGIFPE